MLILEVSFLSNFKFRQTLVKNNEDETTRYNTIQYNTIADIGCSRGNLWGAAGTPWGALQGGTRAIKRLPLYDSPIFTYFVPSFEG